MQVGVVKEIKDRENRVALTPAGAKQLIDAGHSVVLEENAGLGSGFSNAEYESLGVNIVNTVAAWDSDLVIKIKEPQEREYAYLKDNLLFTYLHLSGVAPSLTRALLEARTTGIAYETVEDEDRRFPLLAPMSAIAGNMAASVGSYYLARFNGGRGVQMGAVQGERHGNVMVIGNGIVGLHAAFTADGMGSNVTVYGRNVHKLQRAEIVWSNNIHFIESTPEVIARDIQQMDLVVGAVLLPGARAPSVVSEAMVKTMPAGAVIVDVSIDQGGCIETSHPTSHSDPVFTQHDVIHYCVTNMPGAYPRTATIALTNVTLPYVIQLANHGIDALRQDACFSKGLNTWQGYITYPTVAADLQMQDHFRAFS